MGTHDLVAVEPDPDTGDLRGAVGSECHEVSEGIRLEELARGGVQLHDSRVPRPAGREPLTRGESDSMNLGLRTILLIVAVVLFVLAALTDSNSFDLLAFGLACLAGAFVVDELGVGTRLGSRR
jgi:hypothetical protein